MAGLGRPPNDWGFHALLTEGSWAKSKVEEVVGTARSRIGHWYGGGAVRARTSARALRAAQPGLRRSRRSGAAGWRSGQRMGAGIWAYNTGVGSRQRHRCLDALLRCGWKYTGDQAPIDGFDSGWGADRGGLQRLERVRCALRREL